MKLGMTPIGQLAFHAWTVFNNETYTKEMFNNVYNIIEENIIETIALKLLFFFITSVCGIKSIEGSVYVVFVKINKS